MPKIKLIRVLTETLVYAPFNLDWYTENKADTIDKMAALDQAEIQAENYFPEVLSMDDPIETIEVTVTIIEDDGTERAVLPEPRIVDVTDSSVESQDYFKGSGK